VRANVNSVRQNVNSVRTNINTIRSKQTVPTYYTNSFSPVRPQGNWGTTVKTSVGYNWRRTIPNSNYNSGSNFVRTDYPLKNMEDRGIFDSRCSGHMTGNKDHLDDFEEFKGGSVTFGGSKGYITGKGRIKVGNLEFDSVSFVKELGHFNLFSISQICDKQHKVLFTETECLVVTPDFKMPDENQILLKVPRQHNMYSFDMKTPGPAKSFACLIAKATSDESKLWHRRVYNFSKLIFDGIVANLKSKTKFLMYHRFQSDSKHPYLAVALTKKIFGNMKRGFMGVPRPLFLAMLPVVAQIAGQADQAGIQSPPSSSTVPPPPTSQPAPTESTTIPPTPVTEPTSEPSSPSPAPEHETIEHPFEQPLPEHQPSSPRQESDIPQTQAPTHTHEAETGHIEVGEESQEDGKGETDISPQGLESAETLAEVLSQIKTKRRNVKTGVRRRLDAEDVSTGFEGFKEVSTGFTDIKFASENVSSGGEHVSASQREGNAILEETPQTKRIKKQIREEQASLAEIARIQELELSEAQKKRMAQVQEAAQFYTEEDWDTIRAKLEANADLVKEIAGEDVSEADYA
ncbi:hypothetical protein Tco_1149048, partial [Tanacetum coccineum]